MMNMLTIIAPIVFLLVLSLFYFTHARTPPFRDANGNIIPGSIASTEKVMLGGIEQCILIRGRDISKPLLLFLHGGPGMPAMYLAHKFQRHLENHFIVVHWDRRGAGKSYHRNIPKESINEEQLISDTVELVQMLKTRFKKEKIYLVGHSWGTYLGMLVIKRYPELFYAYVGMGQLAFKEEIAEIQDRFIRRCAREQGDREALEELEKKGAAVREKWLFHFGGELYGEKNFVPLIVAGLRSPEYTFMDFARILLGLRLYSTHMKYSATRGDLADDVTSVAVPVYFFTGRHDYCVPFKLTELYYERLNAPAKKMVWFEHSSHFPFFEEREKFAQEMMKVLTETYPK